MKDFKVVVTAVLFVGFLLSLGCAVRHGALRAKGDFIYGGSP